MTDEQINERIAKACGWSDLVIVNGMYGQTDIPNYCGDLNAMHEAEAKQSWGTICKIDSYLKQMFGNVILRCTARQRAEAFLRTIGKWEEAK